MNQFTLDLQQLTVAVGKPFNSDLGGIQEVEDIGARPPGVTIHPSPTVPLLRGGGKSGLTVALGLSGFVALVGGVSLAGGVYGSTTREFGVFGTGVGPELTFIFGTPSDFSGVFVAVAASVTAIPPYFSVGGSVIFSPGPV